MVESERRDIKVEKKVEKKKNIEGWRGRESRKSGRHGKGDEKMLVDENNYRRRRKKNWEKEQVEN